MRTWLKGHTNAGAMASTPTERHGAAQERDPCPQLWVVVPFHNEAPGIQPTLAALAAQRDGNFTLLLVDNGSTDGSADVVRWALSTRLARRTSRGRTPIASPIQAGLPPSARGLPRARNCSRARSGRVVTRDRYASARPRSSGLSSRSLPGSDGCDQATVIRAIARGTSWRRETISPSPPISTAGVGVSHGLPLKRPLRIARSSTRRASLRPTSRIGTT